MIIPGFVAEPMVVSFLEMGKMGEKEVCMGISFSLNGLNKLPVR